MRPEPTCVHPGCRNPATEIAVVDSEWEDTAGGSALMVCAEHVHSYMPPSTAVDAVRLVHRREPRARAG